MPGDTLLQKIISDIGDIRQNIGSLKAGIEHAQESRDTTRLQAERFEAKVDALHSRLSEHLERAAKARAEHSRLLVELSEKLDKLSEEHSSRLEACEEGISNYQRDKRDARVLAIGLGAGTGAGTSGLMVYLSKLLNWS